MITQLVYLKDYNWTVKVYYAVDTYYTEQILGELRDIDCEPDVYNQIKKLLDNFTPNIGFTYTDATRRFTLMIIGITDSAEQFANTYDHEKGHVAMHIAEALNMDLLGEDFQYLQGAISQQLFKKAKRFLCNHCRFKIIGEVLY